MAVREIRSALTATRKEMRESGIRRTSCFNGGHTATSYRLNAEMFRLELLLKDALLAAAREREVR